ncbi:MAG: hypothetical protein QG656_2112, partial [Candidatus Hydrogenedentes bacterium]|nr:hypothetical protein [Candidatus Hydrogenedentota bacterium]
MWNRIALNRTWMCAVLLMVFSVAAGAEDVADLVARMPAQDAAATQQLNDALL